MKAVSILPDGYKEIYSVNLQKNKKLAILINGLALVIAAVFAVPAHFYIPITALFDMEKGFGSFILYSFVTFRVRQGTYL